MTWGNGGLNFDTSQIGTIFSLGGIFLFTYQLFLYARIERWLGPLRTFRWGIILSIPVFFVLPNVGLLHRDAETYPNWMIWAATVACQCLRTCGALQAFTSSFIMTANSCPSHSRGSANGLTQSFGAASRMVWSLISLIISN